MRISIKNQLTLTAKLTTDTHPLLLYAQDCQMLAGHF
jgi:hypothetical protein